MGESAWAGCCYGVVVLEDLEGLGGEEEAFVLNAR